MYDKDFSALNLELDTRCNEAAETFAGVTMLCSSIYGQYDVIVGSEWTGPLSMVEHCLTMIDDCGGTAGSSRIHNTKTFVAIDPFSSYECEDEHLQRKTRLDFGPSWLRDCDQRWDEGYPVAIGIVTTSGRTRNVRVDFAEHLSLLSLKGCFFADLVTGEFDLLVVLVLHEDDIVKLDDILSLHRRIEDILTSETMFSYKIMDRLRKN